MTPVLTLTLRILPFRASFSIAHSFVRSLSPASGRHTKSDRRRFSLWSTIIRDRWGGCTHRVGSPRRTVPAQRARLPVPALGLRGRRTYNGSSDALFPRHQGEAASSQAGHER